MRCDESELTASARLDKRLSTKESSKYRAHVDACADCRTHLEELEQVSRILKSTSRPVVSPQLRYSIMNMITGK
jgi:anti-sigma factor RsiW